MWLCGAMYLGGAPFTRVVAAAKKAGKMAWTRIPDRWLVVVWDDEVRRCVLREKGEGCPKFKGDVVRQRS